jgi:hypothetical protein
MWNVACVKGRYSEYLFINLYHFEIIKIIDISNNVISIFDKTHKIKVFVKKKIDRN